MDEDLDGTRLWSEFIRANLSLLHIHYSNLQKAGKQHHLILHSFETDLVQEGCDLIHGTWMILAANPCYSKVLSHFMPRFVGAFLEMALSKDRNLKQTGVDILFSMILLDFNAKGSFSRVENEIFEQMPWLVEKMQDRGRDAEMIKKFEDHFANAPVSDLQRSDFAIQGKKFLDFLDNFLSLASEINALPTGASNEDEKADAMLKMISFLSQLDRPAMLTVFLQSLYDLHLSCENYVEAAMLLKQYADSLPWSDYAEERLADTNLEDSLPSHREEVYLRCIDMFERGNAWERAIDLCKSISDIYSTKIFDYNRLSAILRRQAELYDRIQSKDRYFPNYYRVGFYGNGFPPSINGKVFVYKGLEWEKLGSFCDRILKRYPGSKIVKALPQDSTENMRLIHVTWLDALVDLKMLPINSQLHWPQMEEQLLDTHTRGPLCAENVLNSKETSELSYLMPDFAIKYYKANETNIFSCSRPFRKEIDERLAGLSRDVQDYLATYSEQTVIYTKERFPGVRRRSEIVKTHTFEISPLENAIIMINNKTSELTKLLVKYSDNLLDVTPGSPTLSKKKYGELLEDASFDNAKRSSTSESYVNTSPFTMALNGAIDAPVNGGIPMFRNAFYNEDYKGVLSEAEKMGLLEILQQAIDEQVVVMHKCLRVHQQIVMPEMKPLHDELVSCK